MSQISDMPENVKVSNDKINLNPYYKTQFCLFVCFDSSETA